MDILFTDLDNTLIYSRKTFIEDKINVEIYNGEEISFMSKYSNELLCKLSAHLLIVPITTRTYTQYKRINLGILPEYVLCANGGILLKNGIISEEWYKKSLDIVKDSASERKKAFDILKGDNIENVGNTFYAQYFFELPETNKKLFYASDICDVFGAMGSWNDSPPCYAAEKGLENEYNNLSSELLTQIRLALLYSVNEW